MDLYLARYFGEQYVTLNLLQIRLVRWITSSWKLIACQEVITTKVVGSSWAGCLHLHFILLGPNFLSGKGWVRMLKSMLALRNTFLKLQW